MKKLTSCITCLTMLLMITGCNTIAARKNDGRAWVPLSCSGILQWDTCFKEADALCPQGFDIANKIEQRSSQSRKMEIACKG